MPPLLKILGLIALLAAVVGIILVVASVGHRGIADETCRFRLLRLGNAVVAWIDDHGRAGFPPVVNGLARQPWNPGRGDSASEILGDYLRGSAPLVRPRPGESAEDFRVRQRDNEMTCCAATGFEYLFNTGELRGLNPAQMPLNRAVWLFRCQDAADGSLPHHDRSTPTRHVVEALGQERQVTRAELDELRGQLAALKAQATEKTTADLEERIRRMDAQARSLQRALDGGGPTGGGDSLPLHRIITEVGYRSE